MAAAKDNAPQAEAPAPKAPPPRLRPVLKIAPQKGPQESFLSSAADICFFGGGAGGGKLLPLDEVLPTPNGWVSMANVKVGDRLFDENGKQCSITHVFAVEPKPILYRLTFDDGTTIDACKDHQWHTYDADDLKALSRCNDAARERRRANRESRAKTMQTKSDAFMAALMVRNKTIKNIRPERTGSVKTTQEIVDSLYVRNGARANHAVRVADSLETDEVALPIDPYLLGLWLGDGTSCNGNITTADTCLAKALRWRPIPSAKYCYNVPGLCRQLRLAGLLKNKHVPAIYLRASRSQRLAILCGLMDTDGTVAKHSGSAEFDNTNESLVDAVIELACSLGHKTGRKTVRQAMLNGKDCGLVYSVKWVAPEVVFRLPRKIALQKIATRRTQKFRYIMSAELIQSRPGRCISVDSQSRLFLAGKRMIPTHNSYALLLEVLRHHNNPKFGAVIFRRNTKQVKNEGGLWDESVNVFLPLGWEPRQSTLEWVSPFGARCQFSHLEYERTVYEWQGSQIPAIFYDEICHFTERQFTYLMSRNRSMSGVPGYIRATCNPDADSWVRKWVDWYIDGNGLPIQERCGKLRYFVRMDNKMIWANSAQELIDRLGPDTQPKSFTFIPSSIYDNRILMQNDPSYLANLKALDHVERERLLGQNWNIKFASGEMFKRHWFGLLKVIPHKYSAVIRFWDRAGSKVSPSNPDPDWTRGLLLYKYPNRTWLIADVRSMRDTPGEVERLITGTAAHDGFNVQVMAQQDPGSAGKDEARRFVQLLNGYRVKTASFSADKVTRARSVSAQAEAGNIYILEGPWNDEFFKELEGFPDGKHDDIVDCLSGAYNELVQHTGWDHLV